jgi:hypothetical protein
LKYSERLQRKLRGFVSIMRPNDVVTIFCLVQPEWEVELRQSWIIQSLKRLCCVQKANVGSLPAEGEKGKQSGSSFRSYAATGDSRTRPP